MLAQAWQRGATGTVRSTLWMARFSSDTQVEYTGQRTGPAGVEEGCPSNSAQHAAHGTASEAEPQERAKLNTVVDRYWLNTCQTVLLHSLDPGNQLCYAHKLWPLQPKKCNLQLLE